MNTTNSLPGHIERIQDHDDRVIEEFWRRYYLQLSRLADQKLKQKGVPPRAYDGEEVAASAMESFFEAVQQARFNHLKDEDELLRLLRSMTARKVIDRCRKYYAVGNGGGRVGGDSVLAPTDSSNGGFDVLPGGAPTPDWISLMEEEVERLLAKLGSDELRVIAQLRLAKFSNAEIAAQRNCSVATVERRLKMIRTCWSRDEEEEA